MIRSFLAIELGNAQREMAVRILGELSRIPAEVKWVKPEQLHLTLKFFGSIPQETVDRVITVLGPELAQHPRFSLTLKGLGAFPNLRRPRVIWMGVGGDLSSLQELQGSVENRLASIGIPKEERPFRGHLTLGRVKGGLIREEVAQCWLRVFEGESTPFEVTEAVLFRSDLKPQGAIYTPLKVFPLQPSLLRRGGSGSGLV